MAELASSTPDYSLVQTHGKTFTLSTANNWREVVKDFRERLGLPTTVDGDRPSQWFNELKGKIVDTTNAELSLTRHISSKMSQLLVNNPLVQAPAIASNVEYTSEHLLTQLLMFLWQLTLISIDELETNADEFARTLFITISNEAANTFIVKVLSEAKKFRGLCPETDTDYTSVTTVEGLKRKTKTDFLKCHEAYKIIFGTSQTNGQAWMRSVLLPLYLAIGKNTNELLQSFTVSNISDFDDGTSYDVILRRIDCAVLDNQTLASHFVRTLALAYMDVTSDKVVRDRVLTLLEPVKAKMDALTVLIGERSAEDGGDKKVFDDALLTIKDAPLNNLYRVAGTLKIAQPDGKTNSSALKLPRADTNVVNILMASNGTPGRSNIEEDVDTEDRDESEGEEAAESDPPGVVTDSGASQEADDRMQTDDTSGIVGEPPIQREEEEDVSEKPSFQTLPTSPPPTEEIKTTYTFGGVTLRPTETPAATKVPATSNRPVTYVQERKSIVEKLNMAITIADSDTPTSALHLLFTVSVLSKNVSDELQRRWMEELTMWKNWTDKYMDVQKPDTINDRSDFEVIVAWHMFATYIQASLIGETKTTFARSSMLSDFLPYAYRQAKEFVILKKRINDSVQASFVNAVEKMNNSKVYINRIINICKGIIVDEKGSFTKNVEDLIEFDDRVKLLVNYISDLLNADVDALVINRVHLLQLNAEMDGVHEFIYLILKRWNEVFVRKEDKDMSETVGRFDVSEEFNKHAKSALVAEIIYYALRLGSNNTKVAAVMAAQNKMYKEMGLALLDDVTLLQRKLSEVKTPQGYTDMFDNKGVRSSVTILKAKIPIMMTAIVKEMKFDWSKIGPKLIDSAALSVVTQPTCLELVRIVNELFIQRILFERTEYNVKEVKTADDTPVRTVIDFKWADDPNLKVEWPKSAIPAEDTPGFLRSLFGSGSVLISSVLKQFQDVGVFRDEASSRMVYLAFKTRWVNAIQEVYSIPMKVDTPATPAAPPKPSPLDEVVVVPKQPEVVAALVNNVKDTLGETLDNTIRTILAKQKAFNDATLAQTWVAQAVASTHLKLKGSTVNMPMEGLLVPAAMKITSATQKSVDNTNYVDQDNLAYTTKTPKAKFKPNIDSIVLGVCGSVLPRIVVVMHILEKDSVDKKPWAITATADEVNQQTERINTLLMAGSKHIYDKGMASYEDSTDKTSKIAALQLEYFIICDWFLHQLSYLMHDIYSNVQFDGVRGAFMGENILPIDARKKAINAFLDRTTKIKPLEFNSKVPRLYTQRIHTIMRYDASAWRALETYIKGTEKSVPSSTSTAPSPKSYTSDEITRVREADRKRLEDEAKVINAYSTLNV